MKKVDEDKEREWYLVDKWETEAGLKARLMQCRWKAKDILPDNLKHTLSDHYTGYVKTDKDISWKEAMETFDVHGGVTHVGELRHTEGHWIGFDTAHVGDEHRQGEKWEKHFKEECEKLAKQIDNYD